MLVRAEHRTAPILAPRAPRVELRLRSAPRAAARPQLLAESLVLAVLGAVAGLVFAVWASRAVVAGLATPDTPVSLNLPLDWRVLAMTASTALLTALLFGTGPAFHASRAAPIGALTQRSAGGGSGSRRAGGLLVLQLAVSLVLLATAGLFVSTFKRLAAVPAGVRCRSGAGVDCTARAHADHARSVLPPGRRGRDCPRSLT